MAVKFAFVSNINKAISDTRASEVLAWKNAEINQTTVYTGLSDAEVRQLLCKMQGHKSGLVHPASTRSPVHHEINRLGSPVSWLATQEPVASAMQFVNPRPSATNPAGAEELFTI